MGKAFVSYKRMERCTTPESRNVIMVRKGIPFKDGVFDEDYLIEQEWKKDGIEYTWQRKKPLES